MTRNRSLFLSFKEKLKKHFNDQLSFVAQAGKSDLVCSCEVSVGDALKKVASLNLQINESGECEFTSEDASDVDSVVILLRADGTKTSNERDRSMSPLDHVSQSYALCR